MAQALVVAMVCAVVASAASYGDYAGARMPHYRMDYDSHESAGRDLYPERSPDAPVSLDYKYEEDPGGKLERSTEKVADENESWLRTKKKRNRLLDVDHEYNQELDKYSSTEDREENAKSSRVQLRNRPNFKRKKFHIEDEAFTQRDRRKYDDSNLSREMLQRLSEDRFRNSRNFDKNTRNAGYGRGLAKTPRRKPRDKAMDPLLDDSPSDGMLMAEKVFDTDDSAEDDVAQLTQQRRMMNPGRPVVTPPELDGGNKANFKRPDKTYSDYDEFYDMKRVLNIKNKLPMLLRRTKASYPTTATTARQEEWYRRAEVPDRPNEQDELESDTTPPAFTTEPTSTYITTTRRSTTVRTTTKTTTTAKSTTITRKTTPKTIRTLASSSELSLAEKSRLSILRKAQRKENLKSGTVTTKPPVLMQVSQRMQTLVMVEPPGGEVQRMAVREISNDSPERVAKAKRLIRHKLLANAKSIHDLTDNWDDTVCPETTVSTTNLAERELDVVLGRRRKEAPMTLLPRATTPPTFPPNVIEPSQQVAWNHFVLANKATPPTISMFIPFLVLIQCLQYYSHYLFHKTKTR